MVVKGRLYPREACRCQHFKLEKKTLSVVRLYAKRELHRRASLATLHHLQAIHHFLKRSKRNPRPRYIILFAHHQGPINKSCRRFVCRNLLQMLSGHACLIIIILTPIDPQISRVLAKRLLHLLRHYTHPRHIQSRGLLACWLLLANTPSK